MDIYQTRCDNMSYHDARGFEDRRQAMALYRQTEDSTYINRVIGCLTADR